MSKFKRITQWRPAFDKRHTDPKQNYGIGAVTVRFVLVGEKGATQFVMSTGWYLKHNHDELAKKAHSGLAPMAYDWGYHAREPQYEGQSPMGACEYLDGANCYYGGSSLYADKIMEQFFANGEEWLWDELHKEYNERFGEMTAEQILEREG
ncbi:MAG: hypothetical protein KIT08_01200 [Anaerolineales bacterium]|nr:MAG: hypothetical protein KIT08_01200 [Anaerolineales bacterium]